MDAIKGNINSILNGYKQFIIPVYQRTYSWEKEQCERLWKDIVEMQKENRVGHFVGSIVNIAEQAMPTGVQKYMIIDGQQRMTTLTILLIALRDYGIAHPEDTSINPNGINGMCIQNDYAVGKEKYKLLLTQTDQEVLIKLIEKTPLDGIKFSRVLDTYYFFTEKIERKELTLQQIQEGVAKLQIVNITLDRVEDDAQLIFESLNSTGMDLSQSDLIRNYILMGLEQIEQDNIYNNYWFPMEKLFDYEKQSTLMDQFFRDYLSYKRGRIPALRKIYEEFKIYHRENVKVSILEFCKDLYINAKYYTNMYYARSGIKELDSCFKDIAELKMEVSFPFLLKVYTDYEREIIDKQDFCEVLGLCESYVFRRAISGIPTNSLNKTFIMLTKVLVPGNYLNSIKAYFILLDSYKVFPNDEQFGQDFAVRDIYNMRICNYILGKFENYNNKLTINSKDYTIEHIMPQNKKLNVEWKEALGDNWEEIQKKYLHTIGNLTLTVYNSEMSDEPFCKKLSMTGGFKESALRLNSYVVKQNIWNETTLKERTKLLIKLAEEIWSYPKISEDELAKFQTKDEIEIEYALDSYEHLSGDMLKLYYLLDKRIHNISSSVKRELKKLYIAYKVDTNFLDIVPQKSRLRLSLNMKFSEIIDPKGLCKDVTNKGRWGNGDIEVGLENESQLDDVMELIVQSFNKQMD